MLKPLGEDFSEALVSSKKRARDALIEQGVDQPKIELHRRARLRTAGSDTTLEIAVASVEQMRADFARASPQRFGYSTRAPK